MHSLTFDLPSPLPRSKPSPSSFCTVPNTFRSAPRPSLSFCCSLLFAFSYFPRFPRRRVRLIVHSRSIFIPFHFRVSSLVQFVDSCLFYFALFDRTVYARMHSIWFAFLVNFYLTNLDFLGFQTRFLMFVFSISSQLKLISEFLYFSLIYIVMKIRRLWIYVIGKNYCILSITLCFDVN